MSVVWSRGGAGADEDLWDDTELIRAYDDALRSFKKSQAKETEQSEPGQGAESASDHAGPEKRAKSPEAASAAAGAAQPAPKRAKPAAPKKPAAARAPVSEEALAGAGNVANAAEGDAGAQQAYWQSVRAIDGTLAYGSEQYYAQQAAWYPQQAVAPSYFAPSVAAPLAPVQDEALAQLLSAWYNAGYQAGRYQALRGAPS